MTDREKLIKLLDRFTDDHSSWTYDELADYLLANGVIVPTCSCAECKYLKIVDEAPIFAKCNNSKVIRTFLYFEEDTRKASCEYAEEKLKELNKGGK